MKFAKVAFSTFLLQSRYITVFLKFNQIEKMDEANLYASNNIDKSRFNSFKHIKCLKDYSEISYNFLNVSIFISFSDSKITEEDQNQNV